MNGIYIYNTFDRLTTGTSYALNGNIGNKTGIGKYTYDATKKHAVVQVENSGNLISKENVEVTYNAFNKVETVTKGNLKLTITYGPDRQRTRTVLLNGNNLGKCTLYAENYEQLITANGNSITHYHYIYSPDGLVAVYVKNNGATAGDVYYVETDHLGSIVRAYDYVGNTKFSATYDPWGNQTISTNAIGISRGYTGHEHWNQFGLIDMNGRFYDPLLGRFLSPDPYVQAPENPQNFNRYSYCLNNPLKYTDPSGEWILTWGFGKKSFSIGLNFAPYPFGFGINVDWNRGFSLGVYGEFGERAGGTGLGAGAYIDQGFSFNFKHNEWNTFTSEGAYASLGPLSVGGSYNQNYNITNDVYSDNWSMNAGLGWGSEFKNGYSYGYSLGVSYTSGSDGGFSWGIGGNVAYTRPTNEKEFVQYTKDDGTTMFGNVTANDYYGINENNRQRYATDILDNPSVIVDDPYVTFELHKDNKRISGFDKGKNIQVNSSPFSNNTFSFSSKNSLCIPKSVTLFGIKNIPTITPQRCMRWQRRHVFKP